MPTVRTRTKRPNKHPQFTPRALALFREMEAARSQCTCPEIDWQTPDAYWKT